MGSPIGRNEPCPCKSGKKYKRCCGINAAPKLNTPVAPQMPTGPGNMPFDVNSLDPEWMGQFSKALQRLPHGQMQKLQAMMQKAMSGKDVSREAETFEKTLPPELQSLLLAFKMPAGVGTPGMDIPTTGTEISGQTSDGSEKMSEEEARKIVAAAAESGKISQDEAKEVLGADNKKSKFSKLWKSFK